MIRLGEEGNSMVDILPHLTVIIPFKDYKDKQKGNEKNREKRLVDVSVTSTLD